MNMSGRDYLHIYESAEESFPKDNDADNVEMRNEVEHGMQREQNEIGDLEK